MYDFPRGNPGKKLSFFLENFYLSMLRYYVLLLDTDPIPLQNDLRWLLRRGSPLPIPNRVVKPACADGTAVMWESMSSPFFNLKFIQVLLESSSAMVGIFCFFIALIITNILKKLLNLSSINIFDL